MTNIIEEIKGTLWMEIRPTSKGLEYLEGVINKKDLELLNSLLKKRLGPAARQGMEKCYGEPKRARNWKRWIQPRGYLR